MPTEWRSSSTTGQIALNTSCSTGSTASTRSRSSNLAFRPARIGFTVRPGHTIGGILLPLGLPDLINPQMAEISPERSRGFFETPHRLDLTFPRGLAARSLQDRHWAVLLPHHRPNASGGRLLHATRQPGRGAAHRHRLRLSPGRACARPGWDMQSKYKETSLGGLAANVAIC
jgi:hypothetical protein